MKNYVFQYVREQRATISVAAENDKDALEKAWNEVSQAYLWSADDESDDPGELYLIDESKETR